MKQTVTNKYVFEIVLKKKAEYLLILFQYDCKSTTWTLNVPLLSIAKANTNYAHFLVLFAVDDEILDNIDQGRV